jgi:hypothetical protein
MSLSPKELQDHLDELEASRKRAWDQPLTLRFRVRARCLGAEQSY